jgi:hypothetical protein
LVVQAAVLVVLVWEVPVAQEVVENTWVHRIFPQMAAVTVVEVADLTEPILTVMAAVSVVRCEFSGALGEHFPALMLDPNVKDH